jgi:hypothetical protein
MTSDQALARLRDLEEQLFLADTPSQKHAIDMQMEQLEAWLLDLDAVED